MQSTSKPLYKGVQIIWYGLYLIEVLLIARFVLKLTGANPDDTFTDIMYTLSGIFVTPFLAVFSNNSVAGSTFEWTTLLAMVVYWGIAIAFVKFLVMSKPVSTQEADVRLSREERR